MFKYFFQSFLVDILSHKMKNFQYPKNQIWLYLLKKILWKATKFKIISPLFWGMLRNVKTGGNFLQILWPFQKTWNVTEYWLCFYIFEQCWVRQKCWSYCKIWLLKRGLMQQKTWSDFDSLSSYTYIFLTHPRALTTAQDGESFNGKYNNFLKKES